MESLAVVKLKISPQALNRFFDAAIILEIDLFVFHTSPQSLNEDVVQRSTPAIHAYADVARKQLLRKPQAGELRSLIGVEDFRLRFDQRAFQSRHTKTAV